MAGKRPPPVSSRSVTDSFGSFRRVMADGCDGPEADAGTAIPATSYPGFGHSCLELIHVIVDEEGPMDIFQAHSPTWRHRNACIARQLAS